MAPLGPHHAAKDKGPPDHVAKGKGLPPHAAKDKGPPPHADALNWPWQRHLRFLSLSFDAEKAQVLDALMRMPGLFVLLTNTDFELLSANDYFYAFFDCMPSFLVGKPLYGFLSDDVNPGMNRAHIAQVIACGHVWEHIAATTRPDGEPLLVSWNQMLLSLGNHQTLILSVGIPQAAQALNETNHAETNHAETNHAETLPDKRPDATEPDAQAAPAQPCAAAQNAGGASHRLLVSEDEISAALKADAFELFYQPLIHARSKKIVGAEALLRMNHPLRGKMAPAPVVATAERTGQIIPIGQVVIHAACRKLKAWSDAGLDLTLSVNLSPRQFLHEGLPSVVLREVTLHDVSAGHLYLEIREDGISHDTEKTREILRTLRRLGCKICLDDFGTGFSSLRNLESLEIDNIKIDHCFLPSAGNNRKSYALVESIIMLAHGMGFSVTAEGVETEEQVETLLEMSCDLFQGYIFSRPMPEREFDRLLLESPGFYLRNM